MTWISVLSEGTPIFLPIKSLAVWRPLPFLTKMPERDFDGDMLVEATNTVSIP